MGMTALSLLLSRINFAVIWKYVYITQYTTYSEANAGGLASTFHCIFFYQFATLFTTVHFYYF